MNDRELQQLTEETAEAVQKIIFVLDEFPRNAQIGSLSFILLHLFKDDTEEFEDLVSKMRGYMKKKKG